MLSIRYMKKENNLFEKKKTVYRTIEKTQQLTIKAKFDIKNTAEFDPIRLCCVFFMLKAR